MRSLSPIRIPFVPLAAVATAFTTWNVLRIFKFDPGLVTPAIIIAVGLMLFVFEVVLEARQEERQDEASTLIEEALRRFSEPLNGVTKVYRFQGEAEDEYNDQLARVTRRADIMDTSLFRTVVDGRNRRRWEEALRRGVRFRVLLFDPRSSSISSLATAIGTRPSLLGKEIIEALDVCRSLSEQFPHFEFRLYLDPQPFHIYILEDFAILIPRLPLRTQTGLALQVQRGQIFSDIEDLFDSVWAMSATALEYQTASS